MAVESQDLNDLQQSTITDSSKSWCIRPFLIAGPCSAESPEQILSVARRLKMIGGVNMMRAGIWKPRTRPGSFEGIGEEALPWMQQAFRETGLPFIVEVATAKQLEAALKYDAAAVWIGARSTANPFSVQQIADALKGTDIPVFLKNPTNPDVDLWVGGVERLEKAGIEKIGLIHRGFSFYGKSEYRNAPTWQLAIDMKRRYPHLPFLVDPSHICGNRHLLKKVIQTAVDLNYDGVMIESHPTPEKALSDAAQQITPEQLMTLLHEIVWRKEGNVSDNIQEQLAGQRQIIDQVDDEILGLLSRRMQIAEDIGKFKKAHNLTILQVERWKSTLARLTAMADDLKLSPEFIKKYYDAIHLESIDHQGKIMNDTSAK